MQSIYFRTPLTMILKTKIFSLGQGITAERASVKYSSRCDRNASCVISDRRIVMELKSIDSVTNRTWSDMLAVTSLSPSEGERGGVREYVV